MLALSVPAASSGGTALPEALRERLASIRWNAALVERLVREMPKVESHVHLDGALSPSLIRELAIAQGVAPLAQESLEEIRSRAVVATPRGSLQEVLDAFGTVLPLLHRSDAVERAAYELVAAVSAQHVRHLEVRFAPALQATPSFSQDDVLAAALRGLERGRRERGVSYGVILCLIRPFELVSREQNEAMLALAIRNAGRGVVGIDLAGNEAATPLGEFASFFRRAKGAGLRTTVHAGEVDGSPDIETALELGVDRLGHATTLARQPGLMRRVASRRIPIEVNLTSNLRTGAVTRVEDHPVRELFRAGIPVTLSTDDPGVFDVDLGHEYALLAGPLHFTPQDVLTTSFQGIDALFVSGERKLELRREFEAALHDLLARLGAAALGH
jgi:adenosine deaminase